MDLAADLTTGIWVVAVEVATEEVGTAGRIEFMAKLGWQAYARQLPLTIYILFTGALALLFFSAFLGT